MDFRKLVLLLALLLLVLSLQCAAIQRLRTSHISLPSAKPTKTPSVLCNTVLTQITARYFYISARRSPLRI